MSRCVTEICPDTPSGHVQGPDDESRGKSRPVLNGAGGCCRECPALVETKVARGDLGIEGKDSCDAVRLPWVLSRGSLRDRPREMRDLVQTSPRYGPMILET